MSLFLIFILVYLYTTYCVIAVLHSSMVQVFNVHDFRIGDTISFTTSTISDSVLPGTSFPVLTNYSSQIGYSVAQIYRITDIFYRNDNKIARVEWVVGVPMRGGDIYHKYSRFDWCVNITDSTIEMLTSSNILGNIKKMMIWNKSGPTIRKSSGKNHFNIRCYCGCDKCSVVC